MPEMRFSESVSACPEGGVLVVTINNPPVNALSAHVRSGLIAALDNAAADEAVTGIVITGAGGVFIGGADIREFAKPVAAAINGAALGGVPKLRWPAMAVSPA